MPAYIENILPCRIYSCHKRYVIYTGGALRPIHANAGVSSQGHTNRGLVVTGICERVSPRPVVSPTTAGGLPFLPEGSGYGYTYLLWYFAFVRKGDLAQNWVCL